jgi:hypothetical protein
MRRSTIALVALLAAANSTAGAADAPDALHQSAVDRPLAVKHVDLGPSPYSKGERSRLTCTMYPGLMVKEVDRRQEGDDRIAFVTLPQGAAIPPCALPPARSERAIGSDWSGYLLGVKNGVVLVSAADGENGAIGVALYDPVTARQLFIADVTGGIVFPASEPNTLLMNYQRTFVADCSIPAKGVACWRAIAARNGLGAIAMPDCDAAYAAGAEAMAQARCELAKGNRASCLAAERARLMAQYQDDPSVIGVAVQATVTVAGGHETLVGTAARCWAAE